jgi:hypothetical protein
MPAAVIVVADAMGITDAAIFGDILCARMKQRFETWIMSEVEKGAALPGLYPANAETKARYEATKKK